MKSKKAKEFSASNLTSNEKLSEIALVLKRLLHEVKSNTAHNDLQWAFENIRELQKDLDLLIKGNY